MTALGPIAAFEPASGVGALGGIGSGFGQPFAQPATVNFGDMLMEGLRSVDTKLDNADQLVRQFVLDDSVPVHQVTIALEQARLSVELAMQVRTRLVEGYRELMNMQL